MSEVAVGIACICVPAAIWRVHTVGRAEIYRRIAGELLARAEALDAYDAALSEGRARRKARLQRDGEWDRLAEREMARVEGKDAII